MLAEDAADVDALVTAQAVDPATLAALQTDAAAGAAEIGHITSALDIGADQAGALLISLGDPAAQADLALVQRYGTVLEDAIVLPAAEENPPQWEHRWWVCLRDSRDLAHHWIARGPLRATQCSPLPLSASFPLVRSLHSWG